MDSTTTDWFCVWIQGLYVNWINQKLKDLPCKVSKKHFAQYIWAKGFLHLANVIHVSISLNGMNLFFNYTP